jgi:hypothetical protein
MSIYATPISQLKTSDLAELLQEQAVENTRLEFKREVPGCHGEAVFGFWKKK